MKYCYKCGKEIEDHLLLCKDCQVTTSHSQSPTSGQIVDAENIGWSLSSFFIPIIGIILYFTWKNERPQTCISLKKGFIAFAIYFAAVMSLAFCIIAVTFLMMGFVFVGLM